MFNVGSISPPPKKNVLNSVSAGIGITTTFMVIRRKSNKKAKQLGRYKYWGLDNGIIEEKSKRWWLGNDKQGGKQEREK